METITVYLTIKQLETIYALIVSRLDNCASLPPDTIKELDAIQKRLLQAKQP